MEANVPRVRQRHVTHSPDPAATRRITVLCVDDHRIVREGLRMIINSEPDMAVIDTAATGGEAVARLSAALPRHHADGSAAAGHGRRGRDPGDPPPRCRARIIVLTMYKGDEDIHRAIAAGASTYLLKDTLADDLPRIVREVHAGRQTLPPDVQAKLQERAAAPDADAAGNRGDEARRGRTTRQGNRRRAVDQHVRRRACT